MKSKARLISDERLGDQPGNRHTELNRRNQQTKEAQDFGREVIDSLSAHICVLDEAGAIIAVNKAWRDFAAANQLAPGNVAEGTNYLAVCDAASGSGKEAAAFAAGIRGVMRGDQEEFSLEYPCHSPGQERWFVGRVTRFPGEGPARLVVAHENITERKQAEQAQQESQQKFRSLFDRTKDAILVFEVGGSFLDVNLEACERLGYSREELLQMGPQDIDTPEYATKVPGRIEEVLRQGHVLFESAHKRRDGTVVPVEINSSRLEVGGRKLIFSVCRDLTARKRAEEALRRSEEMHRVFFELGAVGMAHVSPDGHYLKANDKYCEITGYTRAELAGLTFFDVTHPDDRQRDREVFDSYARGELPVYALEKRYLRKDGLVRWVAVTARMVYDPEGQPRYSIGIIQDITERKQAEQALRELAEQRRLALESGDQGTWDYNLAAGTILYDERAQAIFGVSGTPLEYEKILAAIHPEDQGRVDQAMKQATRPDSSGAYQFEHRVVWPDGSLHWVLGKGQAYFEGQGAARRAVRFIGTVMDISERKRLEEILADHRAGLERLVAERTAELSETIAELEQFSYAIIHDMRSPLRAMQGFATMFEEKFGAGLPPEGRDYSRRIQEASIRMDQLITDSLQYSKVLRRQLPMTVVDVPALLRGVIESYPELQSPGVEIHVELARVKVRGNEAALTQCFSNLLRNAVKFAKPGVRPRVRIWAEERIAGLLDKWINVSEGAPPSSSNPPTPSSTQPSNHPPIHSSNRFVRLCFEDNGIGIEKEFQPRIFDMFQRGTNEQPGTGIGLAIVRKAVQRMGGRVGVESEPGQGSRFWLELPIMG